MRIICNIYIYVYNIHVSCIVHNIYSLCLDMYFGLGKRFCLGDSFLVVHVTLVSFF